MSIEQLFFFNFVWFLVLLFLFFSAQCAENELNSIATIASEGETEHNSKKKIMLKTLKEKKIEETRKIHKRANNSCANSSNQSEHIY